jgi:O-antigen ligase
VDARQKRRRALARLAGVIVLVALPLIGLGAGPAAAGTTGATAPTTGVLASAGSPVGLLVAIGLAVLAVASVATAEWRRPRRRATDPRIRHRIASLLDRTP